MDETQLLQEGQIYCAFTRDGKDVILEGQVVITRCPALHPGDVQLVEAVDVPVDSPLRALHNCIIFSAKGDRDLPSMLSGGDLDGDLYNVIWDGNLKPGKISMPADYDIQQPIDIKRTVERSDITDFFIQFMENDQLGRIATLHQTLADHHNEGTYHSDCIKLAGLHSTAVDFSKTGIPVQSLYFTLCLSANSSIGVGRPLHHAPIFARSPRLFSARASGADRGRRQVGGRRDSQR